MDIKNDITYRKGNLELYRTDENVQPYDYARNGILIRCVPKILFHGNPVLTTFLQLIDMKLILLMKYIDRIKNFKNIAGYN